MRIVPHLYEKGNIFPQKNAGRRPPRILCRNPGLVLWESFLTFPFHDLAEHLIRVDIEKSPVFNSLACRKSPEGDPAPFPALSPAGADGKKIKTGYRDGQQRRRRSGNTHNHLLVKTMSIRSAKIIPNRYYVVKLSLIQKML